MRGFILLAVAAISLFLSGCASPRCARRAFQFGQDTFAFANELNWQYEFSESGSAIIRNTEPPPEYALRCFPMVRATREFFYHAQFRPELTKTNEPEYRKLIKTVLHRNSRSPAAPEKRVAIPGYANLHEFSAEQAQLLQSECGGAWRSFLQRGNWRMVFPVTHAGQRKIAERLAHEINSGQLAIVHVYRFPDTSLNHALLLYATSENESRNIFSAYDPNESEHPASVTFDRTSNTFLFERNRYFAGGPVRVYEVYRGFLY